MKRKLSLSEEKLPLSKKIKSNTWTCKACTFENTNSDYLQCEICATPREMNLSKQKPASQWLEIQGDLLQSKEQYICHQCNTTTKGARGLAKVLFRKYPYANVYDCKTNSDVRKVGNIEVRGTGNQTKIVAMYAQRKPGSWFKRGYDTTELREQWFRECLRKVAAIPDLKSIAFPARIGCGLAKGNWTLYKDMLRKELFDKVPGLKLVIYDIGR